MKRKFYYKDENSHKFWFIEMQGCSYTIYFGEVGTEGGTRTKTHSTQELCEVFVNSLVASKIQQKYVEEFSENTFFNQHRKTFDKQYEQFEDVTDFYYAQNGALDRLLNKMQDAFEMAAEQYAPIKEEFIDNGIYTNNEGEELYVTHIYLDESECKLTFSTERKQYYSCTIGEPMVEALVLIEKMGKEKMSDLIMQWFLKLRIYGLCEYNITDEWNTLSSFMGYGDKE